MKIAVTGSSGYIGRHLVRYLCNHNHVVYSVSLSPLPIDLRSRSINVNIDILESSKDKNLFEKIGSPDVIIHLAWKDGFNHSSDSHIENLPKHYSFLKNMINSGVSSISIMGSMHEIGYYEGSVKADTPCNPLSLYGIAKNALRQSILTYSYGKSTKVKWLRAFYVVGDDANNNSIFTKILDMNKKGFHSFPFTNGINKYDFIDIQELVKQISAASLQNNINGIINVCSGEAVSLKDKVISFIKDNNLDIQPDFGAFPSRIYDSPAIWGDNQLIKIIMEHYHE